MIGHIGAPELSRHFRPEMTDAEVKPATLVPELLQDLLRGELGFNGLIITDASMMVGFTQALLRVLGLKASLGLHETPRDELVPGVDIAQQELDRAGFEVHVFKNALRRAAEDEEGGYFHTVMADEASGDYAEKYDAALVFANVAGFAQEATVRIHRSTPMAAEIPWYVTEVPTVLVSLNQPNHLIDVPMVKTLVHAYTPSRESIRAAVEKITGAPEFAGTFNEKAPPGAPGSDGHHTQSIDTRDIDVMRTHAWS